jgi:hypothetical protein
VKPRRCATRNSIALPFFAPHPRMLQLSRDLEAAYKERDKWLTEHPNYTLQEFYNR